MPRTKSRLAAGGVALIAALPATVGVAVLSAEAAAASSVTQPSVTLSSYEAGATDVTYTVGFKTSATGAIPAGGTINLIAPSGTLWPSGPCSYVLADATTAGGSATGCDDGGLTPKVADPGLPIYNFVSFSGVAVQLTVPNAISAGDALEYHGHRGHEPGGRASNLVGDHLVRHHTGYLDVLHDHSYDLGDPAVGDAEFVRGRCLRRDLHVGVRHERHKRGNPSGGNCDPRGSARNGVTAEW